MNVNLACGGVYVTGTGWLNFDYSSASAAVRNANLLGRLPLADGTADLVYSSHFLEHIPREQVGPFLQECLRILKGGGVLRLVVPDLENLCRTYLHHRDKGEHDKADFVVLELLDQCVRRNSGGELGRYYQTLKSDPEASEDSIAFVRERNGENLMQTSPRRRISLRAISRRLPALAENVWIRAVIQLLPPAFREQNVSLAHVGERHHWLYDFHTLNELLKASGFVAIERYTASTSCHSDFPFYPLDLAADGKPRKGSESLYIEAQKPL
jgi:SAM-dependent methyltransferase